MAPPRHGDSLPPAFGFLPVLVANLPPLIGVLWLDWDPETLVAVYALELQLLFLLAGAKALFAGQPPVSDRESGVISVSSNDLVAKRGSVSVHEFLPPIYPRNVPFVAAVIYGGAWFGLFISFSLSEVIAVSDVIRHPAVLSSVAVLLIGQLGETGYSYIRSGRYADVSPYSVVEIPARQGFFLMVVLFIVPFVAPVTSAAGTTLALVGFVFAKLLFEWSGFRAERDGGGRLTSWLSGPDSDSALEPLDVPDDDPSAAIDVDRRAVAATAVWRAVTTTGPFYATMATFVWLGLIAIVAGEPSPALRSGSAFIAFLLFCIMFCSDIVMGVLKSGWVTYRRTGDQLVAYDRLTGDPQWSAPVSILHNATVVETQFSDRYFGTRRLTVKTGGDDDDTERTLGPVSNPEALIETFELPVRSTELPPLNQWLAGTAVTSACLIVVAGATLLVTPFGPPAGWLYVLLLLPFLAAVPKGFWKLAHA
ncbi:hypothetical protein GL213_06155 [Halogeometricum borinquense]|uniref:Uncharacterized protein n=1 Tax=Halogeometricum borinquense TaxID=60847 RepID=A0A6C0UJT3_9EURY|nr:DUF6498-containing protein [Halogeometricum borinquense]QIB74863.1 hypothetical protein G3I44_11585 [Halogeometricum borinquense]QIQ76138.1 hypothetical protein GL213_06155 [Halogeometricum borinquense]